jgi:copper chaperone
MSEAKAIVVDVKGMTCQGCVNAVTKIVKRADPQAEVKIDLASGRADVTTSAAPEAIAKAINAGGYEAVAR